jgi:hypothetical protein
MCIFSFLYRSTIGRVIHHVYSTLTDFIFLMRTGGFLLWLVLGASSRETLKMTYEQEFCSMLLAELLMFGWYWRYLCPCIGILIDIIYWPAWVFAVWLGEPILMSLNDWYKDYVLRLMWMILGCKLTTQWLIFVWKKLMRNEKELWERPNKRSK